MCGDDAMTFDCVADIWQMLKEGKTLKRLAFVVAKPVDAGLVERVDVTDCFRPTVVGRSGPTVAWAYAECANGERATAKIKSSALRRDVEDTLAWFITVASE